MNWPDGSIELLGYIVFISCTVGMIFVLLRLLNVDE